MLLSFWGSHQISWPWLPSAGAISRRNKPAFWTYTEVLNLRHTGICLLRAATHRLAWTRSYSQSLHLVEILGPRFGCSFSFLQEIHFSAKAQKTMQRRPLRVLVSTSGEGAVAAMGHWDLLQADQGDIEKTMTRIFWCKNSQGGAHHWLLDDLSWCDTSAGPKISTNFKSWHENKNTKKTWKPSIYSEGKAQGKLQNLQFEPPDPVRVPCLKTLQRPSRKSSFLTISSLASTPRRFGCLTCLSMS